MVQELRVNCSERGFAERKVNMVVDMIWKRSYPACIFFLASLTICFGISYGGQQSSTNYAGLGVVISAGAVDISSTHHNLSYILGHSGGVGFSSSLQHHNSAGFIYIYALDDG